LNREQTKEKMANERRERIWKEVERRKEEDKNVKDALSIQVFQNYTQIDNSIKGETTWFWVDPQTFGLFQSPNPHNKERRQLFMGESMSHLAPEAMLLRTAYGMSIDETLFLFDMFKRYQVGKRVPVRGNNSENMTAEEVLKWEAARLAHQLIPDYELASEYVMNQQATEELDHIFRALVLGADDSKASAAKIRKMGKNIVTTDYGRTINLEDLANGEYSFNRLNLVGEMWKNNFQVEGELERFIGLAVKLPNNNPISRPLPSEQRGEALAVGPIANRKYPVLEAECAYAFQSPDSTQLKIKEGKLPKNMELGLYRLHLTRYGVVKDRRELIDDPDGKLFKKGIFVMRIGPGVYGVVKVNDETGTFMEHDRQIVYHTDLIRKISFGKTAHTEEAKRSLRTMGDVSTEGRHLLQAHGVSVEDLDRWYTNDQNKNKILITARHALAEYDIVGGLLPDGNGVNDRKGKIGKLYLYLVHDEANGFKNLPSYRIGVAVQPNEFRSFAPNTAYHRPKLAAEKKRLNDHLQAVKELFCHQLMHQYGALPYLRNMMEAMVVSAHTYGIK